MMEDLKITAIEVEKEAMSSTLHESGALGHVQGDALRAIRGEASMLKLQGTFGEPW